MAEEQATPEHQEGIPWRLGVGGFLAWLVGIPVAWREARERMPNMTLATELEKHFFG